MTVLSNSAGIAAGADIRHATTPTGAIALQLHLLRLIMRWATTARDTFEGIGSLGRYLVTGGVLFLVDLGIFLALVEWAGLAPAFAQPLARASGALAGFFGHRYVTFFQTRDHARHGVALQGGVYLVVSIAMLLVTPFILLFFIALTGDRLVLAKVFTEVVAVIIVFLCLRVIFAARRT